MITYRVALFHRKPYAILICTFLLWIAVCTSSHVLGDQVSQGEALFRAIGKQDVGAVKSLLDKGVNPNARMPRKNGNTALMEACWMGNAEIVKALLKRGANVNAIGVADATALLLAVRRNVQCVKLLVDKGANIHYMSKPLGVNPLIQAAWDGKTDIVKLLIAKGAKVNARSVSDTGKYDGYTALIRAASRGHTEVVRVLLANKAEVDAKAKDGRTAISEATRGGHTEVVNLLRKHSHAIP